MPDGEGNGRLRAADEVRHVFAEIAAELATLDQRNRRVYRAISAGNALELYLALQGLLPPPEAKLDRDRLADLREIIERRALARNGDLPHG